MCSGGQQAAQVPQSGIDRAGTTATADGRVETNVCVPERGTPPVMMIHWGSMEFIKALQRKQMCVSLWEGHTSGDDTLGEFIKALQRGNGEAGEGARCQQG